MTGLFSYVVDICKIFVHDKFLMMDLRHTDMWSTYISKYSECSAHNVYTSAIP